MRYQIENGTVSLGGKTVLDLIDFSVKRSGKNSGRWAKWSRENDTFASHQWGIIS